MKLTSLENTHSSFIDHPIYLTVADDDEDYDGRIIDRFIYYLFVLFVLFVINIKL
jgi:hypothetical protein